MFLLFLIIVVGILLAFARFDPSIDKTDDGKVLLWYTDYYGNRDYKHLWTTNPEQL